jgi:hypothetical protein
MLSLFSVPPGRDSTAFADVGEHGERASSTGMKIRPLEPAGRFILSVVLQRVLFACGLLLGCLVILGALVAAGTTVQNMPSLVSAGLGGARISAFLPVTLNAVIVSCGVVLTTACLAKLASASAKGSSACIVRGRVG